MENKIFEPFFLAGIKIKNRIIRSATHEGMADAQGYPTEILRDTYIALAKGEAGAIITGFTGIQQKGKSPFYRMSMISDDSYIGYYKQLVDEIHKFDTPIIMQIAHCGRQTRSIITGETPVAPSAIRDKYYNEEVPKELTEPEIKEIIYAFVDAIERTKKAGFDAVQLHAAHGYLLSQFLSPYMNRRKDKWGGNTENRFRVVDEIYKEARKKSRDYPILAKINAFDGRKSGMRIEEAISIARLLEKAGCSAIEVSCGVSEDGLFSTRSKKNPADFIFKYKFGYKKFNKLPALIRVLIKLMISMFRSKYEPLYNYNVKSAAAIKKEINIPVIVVGGIRTKRDIAEILENQKADLVSLSRPFIIEPDIVRKFKEKKQESSRCTSCCCCGIALEEEFLRCFQPI